MDLASVCPLTTAGALHRAVTIGPDIEAVVGPTQRLTYSELSEQVARIRAALSAAGVRRGDHIGICLGNDATWVALFFALGSLGAISVPVNTRLRGEEIAYVLRQSRTQMLFVADRFLKIDFISLLRDICPAIDTQLPDAALPDLSRVVVLGTDVPRGARTWDRFLAAAGNGSPPTCTPDDVLLIQYTSGTTAAPKGVVLTHRNVLANGFFAGERMGLRTADRFHSARPFFHVAGTSQSIAACIQHVATLVTMDRFEAGEALRLMEAERCTHFSGNDTMALMLLGHPDRPRRKLALRGAWVAVSPSIMERVMDELGAHEAVMAYGQSEASPNVSISGWWESREIRAAGRMRPQPGVEVRIRDVRTGADCPSGMIGEILVRGWNVMRGYFDKPEETAAALSADGWLATGDLGCLDATGRLQFAGRAKEIIRVGGENVAPAEIEDFLHRHPKIRQAQVVGVPDARLIEVPAAFVVLREGQDCGDEEILAWCRETMAGFKAPRYVRVIADFDAIGMTASGKVQKKELRMYALKALGLER
jgi:fatty-acyl-CoA synthase